MRLRHRIPTDQFERSDPITPAYQREIDETMRRAQTAYDQAERRLQRDERRLEKARQAKPTRRQERQIKELVALVELRREELKRWHQMLVHSPQSAQHRGSRSYRPVPSPEVL
jgi:multidrug efflux pump subunit AcrA (membrane-fusion protein)